MVVAQQVFFLRKRDEVGCVLISCGKTASYTTVGNVLIKFEDCGRSYFLEDVAHFSVAAMLF